MGSKRKRNTTATLPDPTSSGQCPAQGPQGTEYTGSKISEMSWGRAKLTCYWEYKSLYFLSLSLSFPTSKKEEATLGHTKLWVQTDQPTRNQAPHRVLSIGNTGSGLAPDTQSAMGSRDTLWGDCHCPMIQMRNGCQRS